jgi:hypothetical protein
MRTFGFAIAVLAAMFVVPVNAQPRFEIGPGGVRIGGGERYYGGERRYGSERRYGGRCAELRNACLHKGELGEQGEGNCRRYRMTCR